MLSTCDRGPGLPQMGPGPPRAYPDPRELSAQLATREGSGAATCHADADAGASLPLEVPSPTRIKCEWLREALLPLGTGQLCQSTLWITRYRSGSSVTKTSIKDSAPRPRATSHDDQLLTRSNSARCYSGLSQ